MIPRHIATTPNSPTNLQLLLCSGKGQVMRSTRLVSLPGLPEGRTLESVRCICHVSTYLAQPAAQQ